MTEPHRDPSGTTGSRPEPSPFHILQTADRTGFEQRVFSRSNEQEQSIDLKIPYI
jgi:hypothetical protein